MTSFWEVTTVLGAILGAAILALTLAEMPSAPQLAAGCSLALSCAILPYVIASVSHHANERSHWRKGD